MQEKRKPLPWLISTATMKTCLPQLILAAVLVFVPPLAAHAADEPTYRARTAESWASELTRGHKSLYMWFKQPEDAFEAFRELGATAVSVLIKNLKSKNRMVRHNSAEALMLMGIQARDALPALVTALDDEDAEVRGLACDALGALGIEAYSVIPKLQKLLADKQQTLYPPHNVWYLRDRARDALVAIHVDTLPGLMKGIKSSSIEAKMACIPAVGRFPEEAESVVPLLVELLEDPEPGVRSLAATSLRKLGRSARAATGPLAMHLEDAGEHGIGFYYTGTVKYAAALALRQIGPTEKELPTLVRRMKLAMKSGDSLEPVSAGLENNPDYVRYLCATMIGRIGPGARPAIPELKFALKNERLRTAAAASLLLIDPKDLDARQILFESARKGNDLLVIVDTIRRLDWRDDQTVETLKGMMTQRKDRVGIVASGLLLRIDPDMQPAREAFLEGLGDSFDGIRLSYEEMDDDWSAVLSILREVPATTKIALPIAVKNLPDEYRREGAREALIAMSVQRDATAPQLLKQLVDDRLDLRITALEAISLLRPGDPELVSLLITKLDDSAPALRAGAAKALGSIGNREGSVVEALTKRLKDQYATVRMNAANSLAQLGPAAKSSKLELTALRDDKSKPVRDAAARALVAIEK